MKNKYLTDYEHDAMWMSYRYAIGRHTAAAVMHAGNMIKNVYGRLSKDKAEFDAYDMRRELGYHLQWSFNFDMGFIPQQYYDPFKALVEFEKTLKETDIRLLDYLQEHRVAVSVGEGCYTFENYSPIHQNKLYGTQLHDLIVWANTANALDPKKHHTVITNYDGKKEKHDTFESYGFDEINGFSVNYTDIKSYLKNPYQYGYLNKEYIIKIDDKDI